MAAALFLTLLILLSLAPGGRQALQPVTVWPGDERPISAAAAGQQISAAGQGIRSQALALVLYFFCSFYPGQILARSWRRPLDLTFIFFALVGPGQVAAAWIYFSPVLLSKIKALAISFLKLVKLAKLAKFNNQQTRSNV